MRQPPGMLSRSYGHISRLFVDKDIMAIFVGISMIPYMLLLDLAWAVRNKGATGKRIGAGFFKFANLYLGISGIISMVIMLPFFLVFGKKRVAKMVSLQAARNQWMTQHTCPSLGRPDRSSLDCPFPDDEILNRHTPNIRYRPILRGRAYPVPVTAQELHFEEHERIFTWMISHWDDIARQVAPLLRKSFDSAEEATRACFLPGEPKPHWSETDFVPIGITGIKFTGAQPVKWSIDYYSGVGKDVCGRIEGEDEKVLRASLYR